MILYIVRHAWAEERNAEAWPDDSQRPLTESGCKRFSRLVKKLVKIGFSPNMIATSPLTRCQQTADLLAERIAGKPEVVALVALAPCSDLDALTQWSAEHSEEQIAWVGHAPDVGRLASQLIGGESNIRFAKGAVAAIRFESVVQPGAGELQWLATAKLLGV